MVPSLINWCPREKGNFDSETGMKGEPHVNMKTAMYKPRREAWNWPFPHNPQKNQPCRHLDSGLSASQTVKQYISVV